MIRLGKKTVGIFSAGFSLTEVVVAMGIGTFVVLGAWSVFSSFSLGSGQSRSRNAALTATSEVASRILLRSRSAQSVETDPAQESAGPDDPPSAPGLPISTLVLIGAGTSGSAPSFRFQTVCRPMTDSFYQSINSSALNKLAVAMSNQCGSTYYPCSGSSDLPFIQITESAPPKVLAMPTVADRKASGIYAMALCTGWRSDGAGSFDVKVVAGFFYDGFRRVGTVASSASVSNAQMDFGSIKLKLP